MSPCLQYVFSRLSATYIDGTAEVLCQKANVMKEEIKLSLFSNQGQVNVVTKWNYNG
jgi:hypothetical protein